MNKMNERINELWSRAVDSAVPQTYTDLSLEQMEKIKLIFAELIVAECVKLCKHKANNDQYDQYDMGMEVKAEDIKALIKKHFGVKE